MGNLDRPRIVFRLRTLLGFVLLAAVCAAWIRHESTGRLVTEGNSRYATPGPGVDAVVEIGDTADFDTVQYLILSEVRREALERGRQPVGVYLNRVILPNGRFLKFDYEKWGRERLDIWRLAYVFDYSDPVAKSRNDAVVATINRVARETVAVPKNRVSAGEQGGE